MRKTATTVVALLTTAATLTYALWDVDLNALWSLVLSGQTWVFPPFLALLAIFYLLNARRWALMLRPFGHFSIRQVAPSMMIGFAGNNLLPFRLGELVRTLLFSLEHRQPKSGVLMTLVLERVLDVLAILIVYVTGLVMIDSAPAPFVLSAWLATLGLLGALAVILAVLFKPDRVMLLFRAVGESLPPTVFERGTSYVLQIERGLQSLKNPRVALEIGVQSLVRWLLAAGLVWLCVRSYGPGISPGLAFVVLGIIAFAVSLPSAPGFVGPIQAAFVFALTPFGIEREVALAASVLFLLGHWVPVTALGAVLYLARPYSFEETRREYLAMRD